MSAVIQAKREIIEAIVFLRDKNNTIPSETIEFMKQASLEKLNKISSEDINGDIAKLVNDNFLDLI